MGQIQGADGRIHSADSKGYFQKGQREYLVLQEEGGIADIWLMVPI